MPQLIAEIEQPAAVVARHRLVVLAKVGHVVHQRVEPLFVILGDGAAGRVFDLAEIAGESDLLLVGDVLLVEDENRIAVHAFVDRRDFVARQRPAQIDARHFADKDRVDLADRNGHRRRPRA